ncbi:hypothetical protein L7F22_037830 [Adiantum nelumboides]|nr:hypothetical protein [Adiantum nelumboides]
MAHVQFYLPLLSWTGKDISAFMSLAMEMLWRTHANCKAFRLLKMELVCTPRMHGGLNILNIHLHKFARKATLLADFFARKQPWSHMLADMSTSMSTKAYGDWITDHWEFVLGHFEGTIPACPHSTKLILDWKHVFAVPLAILQPIKAYNLMKLGISRIQDVIEDNGCTLSFPHACQKFPLGMHHRPIWRDIAVLLVVLIPIPNLNEEDRLTDWELSSKSPGSRSISLQNWTSKEIYRAILPAPWIQSHGNPLWHMQKSLSWWKSVLSKTWKSKLPLKQRLFLWRCTLGILPVGKILASLRIASSTCRRCLNRLESVSHLLWFCPISRGFLVMLSGQLRSRFPSSTFGKYFWVFGRFSGQIRSHALFMHWVRYWAFSSI